MEDEKIGLSHGDMGQIPRLVKYLITKQAFPESVKVLDGRLSDFPGVMPRSGYPVLFQTITERIPC